jgi:aerotaxis receptor
VERPGKKPCKNGDHYWVRANAIPIIRKGDVKGYMSVRTKPDNDEVVKAEALYQQFREECKRQTPFQRVDHT